MSVLTVDPSTGELLDERDMALVVTQLLNETHLDMGPLVPVGELIIGSGDITVVDPVHHIHKQPLVPRVPAGKHSVSLAFATGSEQAAAAIVRFAEGDPLVIERADWEFPYRGRRCFSLESGIAAIFDYGRVNGLDGDEQARLGERLAAQAERGPGWIRLPRARWNALAFRVAREGNGFYSCHWVRDPAGRLLALVIDFAALA